MARRTAKRAPAKKTAAPRKRRAPARKAPPRKNQTAKNAEMLKELLHRRAVSGNMMAASMFGLSCVVTGALCWFVLTMHVKQNERIARLANAVSIYNQNYSERVGRVEEHTKRLDEIAKDRWRRSNQIAWCLQAEKLNPNFKCPSPLEIAPEQLTPSDVRSLSPLSDKMSMVIRMPSDLR